VKKYWMPVVMVALVLRLGACGQKGADDARWADNYLPLAIDSLALERTSDISRYVGDSLYEYINGGAELYHRYNFEEVATADYRQERAELVADIYRFASAADAFGLYAAMRPPEATVTDRGVEGFATPTSAEFVKGQFLVRLIGFVDSDETRAAIDILSQVIEPVLPGTDQLPPTFAAFPAANAIAASEEIMVEYFLGHKSLSQVYSRRYAVGEDTLMLFMTDDASGQKYEQWSRLYPQSESARERIAAFPYDDGLALAYHDSYYGEIVAGLKQGRLVGVVGYKDSAGDLFVGWLNSMK